VGEEQAMTNKSLENSVRSLVNLYTVVIGIALTLAIGVVIDPKLGLSSVTRVTASLFFGFLATLVPFFHGALRHLDNVYIENDASQMKQGTFIFDFALLLLHALAFLVLAQLLAHPTDFAYFLICVLAIDIVWGIFAYASTAGTQTLSATSRWSIINFVFVVMVLAYLLMHDLRPGATAEDDKLSALLALACLARSAVDYIWCRNFYFPNPPTAAKPAEAGQRG
jgi:hypothetical protein